MTAKDKFNLITRNLEEVLIPEDLKALINSGTPLKHYMGFEISGKVHLGTGLLTMLIIKNLQQAGVKTAIFLADWHTWLNKKLDGKLESATRLAREYFEEGLRAAALAAGANPDDIEFILGTELYQKQGNNYWAEVIKVSKATTLARMIRSTTIMGRKQGEISDSAMLIYPAMQAADIFIIGINIAQAGNDQRNVHVVARDVAEELGHPKPIAIHQHLLQGLTKPPVWPIPEDNREGAILSMKMSKSKPDSAIFIHDNPDEIKRKINNAFAPEGEIVYNPILDWTKHLIFSEEGSQLTIERPDKWGGGITYTAYSDLEKDYGQKNLHPQDLKIAVAEWLIKKLEPARVYFEDPKRKKALLEIEQFNKKF